MSQWVRLWEDMPDDPKWQVVAKRSGRPLSEVVAVFTRMLVNASRSSNRGTLETWNDEDEAIALDMAEENVVAIREAMQGKVLEGYRLTGWEKPKREDSSSERVRAFREREAELKRNETRGNARPNDETHGNAPEERREDQSREEKKERASAPGKRPAAPKTVLLECLSSETADAVIDHRRAKRAPLTERAAQLLVKGFLATGEPEAAALMMIGRGWTGFEPKWFEKEKSDGRNGSVHEAARDLHERLIALGEAPRALVLPADRGGAGAPSIRLLSEGGGAHVAPRRDLLALPPSRTLPGPSSMKCRETTLPAKD